MKRPLVYLLGILALVSIAALQAPISLTEANLTPLIGTWTGSLTYTNYKDNRQVTLPTSCYITKDKKSGVRLAYVYTEPSGKNEEGLTVLKPSKTAGRVNYDDGEWEVKELTGSATTLRLVIEGVGEDNDRKSTIREILVVTGDSLTHQKLVKYDGTAEFFQRNRYAFARPQ
jgi:hypothetical protein